MEALPGYIDGYVDANDMIAKHLSLWGNVAIGYMCVDDENNVPRFGTDDYNEVNTKYAGKGVQSWVELDVEARCKNIQGLPPRAFFEEYQVAANEEFPAVVYWDAETQEIIDDLYVTIKEYANTEAARFITGERPIEELGDYFDEIDALGAQDYIKYHQDYFDSVVGG